MYGGRDLISRASPKSAIFTSSGPMHKRFSGFMSLWKNPNRDTAHELYSSAGGSLNGQKNKLTVFMDEC